MVKNSPGAHSCNSCVHCRKGCVCEDRCICRVLVAVRHPGMRSLIAELLRRDCTCWQISASTESGTPDVAIVDSVDFPACCRSTTQPIEPCKVVVVTPEPSTTYGIAALEHGAAGYVARDDVGAELIELVRRAANT